MKEKLKFFWWVYVFSNFFFFAWLYFFGIPPYKMGSSIIVSMLVSIGPSIMMTYIRYKYVIPLRIAEQKLKEI